tara:strand:- start:147 stop:356 length:210 start_codon:yes stop_codon:yes gene_type:complete
MAYQVSSCCGTDYEERGDYDRFNFYVCCKCNEEFEEPMNDYDYRDLEKMDRDEMEADEYRGKIANIPFG